MRALRASRNSGTSGPARNQRLRTFGYAIMLSLAFSLLTLGSPSVGLPEVSIGNVHAEQNTATTVPVMIHYAADLGSIDLELSFNPAVVTVNSITEGDFDVTVSNLEKTSSGFVKILAFQAAKPGLNNTVVLAQVTLCAVGAVDATTPLNITVNTMTDATPCCRNLSYAITNGSFTVISSAEPTPKPTPRATPSPENGGGGPLFLVAVDSDGDGYSDHYERLTGSDPNDPCDPDPTCSACRASREELLPVVATPDASPRSTPVPSRKPSTPATAIEPAPPPAVPVSKPFLNVLPPPQIIWVILIAGVLLSGLLALGVSRHWRKPR